MRAGEDRAPSELQLHAAASGHEFVACNVLVSYCCCHKSPHLLKRPSFPVAALAVGTLKAVSLGGGVSGLVLGGSLPFLEWVLPSSPYHTASPPLLLPRGLSCLPLRRILANYKGLVG